MRNNPNPACRGMTDSLMMMVLHGTCQMLVSGSVIPGSFGERILNGGVGVNERKGTLVYSKGRLVIHFEL